MEQGKQMIEQLTQENAQLKQDQQAEMAKMQMSMQSDQAKLAQQEQIDMQKIASQERIAMAKLQSDRGLKQQEMMIAGDAQEVEGEDGQMVVKTKAELGNEALMQGLAMIAQLINQGNQGVMAAITAPKQVTVSRDVTGRIDGAVQQTVMQ